MKLKLRLQGQYMLVTFALAVVMTLTSAAIHLWLASNHSQRLLHELTVQNSKTFRAELSKRAEQMSSYLSKAMFDPLYMYNLEEAGYLLEPLLQMDELEKLVVFDSKGHVFHDGDESLKMLGQNLPFTHDVSAVLSKGQSIHEFSNDHLVIIRPIRAADEIIGGIFLEFSLDKVDREITDMATLVAAANDHSQNALYLGVLGAALLLLSFSALMAAIISRHWSRPLVKLTEQAESIGRGDFKLAQTMGTVKRQDEIGCNIGQGYYFDKPMPVDDFVKKLINKSESNVIEFKL